LEYRNQIPEFAGMFQKEVRNASVKKKREQKPYGILSLVQVFDAEYLFTVDETCFIPPPKVNRFYVYAGKDYSLSRKKSYFSQWLNSIPTTTKNHA
jgi:16S rRNA (adenine1518-N6/adenine1519-N6)-dimethyltransferase